MVPYGALEGRKTKLQLLYQLAQQTLAPGAKVTEELVHSLSLALGSVPLAELALERSELCHLAEPGRPGAIGHHMDQDVDDAVSSVLRHPGHQAPALSWARPPITYLHIWEDPVMSLGVFVMPALSQIPLHDHPGMTVFTRVLYGSMHYMSYDWADPACCGDFGMPEAALLVTDRTFGSRDDPIVLFPREGGNIHQLTALTDCAILSLLCPPYSTPEGRDCHYYRALDVCECGEMAPATALLEEVEPPADFYIGCGKYRGVVPRPRRGTSPVGLLDLGSRAASLDLACSASLEPMARAASMDLAWRHSLDGLHRGSFDEGGSLSPSHSLLSTATCTMAAAAAAVAAERERLAGAPLAPAATAATAGVLPCPQEPRPDTVPMPHWL